MRVRAQNINTITMGLKKSSKISAEFNMSSLTDIIFLLLIFFMLTSSLVSPNSINLKLPSTSQNKAKSTHTPLTIKVTETEQYSLNGAVMPFEKLASNLDAAIKRDGRPTKEVTVILEIAPEVQAQVLVNVVEIITQAGTKMVLNTKATAPTSN
jgi:biopolymer transport protein ExbD